MLSRLASMSLLAAQTATGQLPLKPERHLRFEESQGTWMSLDISPDGKTIVFEVLGDLYKCLIAGGEAHCVACGMPFDSQPVYSPDGKSASRSSAIDREMTIFGSPPRTARIRDRFRTLDDNTVFISPAWSADGQVGVCLSLQARHQCLRVMAIPSRWLGAGADHAREIRSRHSQGIRGNALGATVSPDGRYLYYEAKTGLGFDDDVTFPLWHIVRRDLHSERKNLL
jgi:hypothetical protein